MLAWKQFAGTLKLEKRSGFKAPLSLNEKNKKEKV